MNLVIPPVLLYAFGVMLVSLGGLRAYYLGWRKRPEIDDGDQTAGAEAADEKELPEAAVDEKASAAEGGDGDVEPVETVRRRSPWSGARSGESGHRRHLAMGLLYVIMGLFLVVSTALGQRR